MRRLSFTLLTCSAIVLVAVFGAGCGKPSLPTAPVHGKVTLDGQSVNSGQVTLVPQDDKNHTDLSAGTIENGEYKIYTGGSEGAPLGKYKVTVTATMVPTGDSKAPPMSFNRKFGDPKTTPLNFEVVSSPAAGAYDLKLTK